jgi:D-alanyl-D-alanine carboxypeptidase (penicillin-binding protein 5/6)
MKVRRGRWAALAAAGALLLSLPAAGAPPAILAPSAVLMDANSGLVLFEKGAHTRRPMASTTKIMTALVALESAKLDDTVVGTETCTKVEGSCLGLKPGERMKLDDVLTAVMLKSANDAAVALGEHVSGSVEAFVARMNARAEELGAKDTHFANPNGLHDPEHYSTAYDLALITREAMKYPRFRELVRAKAADIYHPDLALSERMINHNKLLWRDESVDGVKTGYVKESGHCLAASATREDWQLITVVLGGASAEDTYTDTQALLDYGFRSFHQELFARRGDAVGQARVAYGARRWVPAVCQYPLSMALGPDLPGGGRMVVDTRKLYAPVKVGQVVGEARLVVGKQVLARTPLLAAEDSPKSWLVVAWVWLLRVVGVLVTCALLVRIGAKFVKAHRRRGRGLPPQGRRPDPVRAGEGGRPGGGPPGNAGGGDAV